LGGAAVEVRLDGGLEARRRSVERRRRSVASGQGKSERVRGKDQGEPPGSGARERKEQRALSWPGHGGGEVAAARSFWAAWRREGRSSAKEEGVEELLCDAWKLEGGRWRGRAAQSGGRAAWRRRSAARESRGAGGRGKGPKRNFQKLQGPFCKPAITFKIELK